MKAILATAIVSTGLVLAAAPGNANAAQAAICFSQVMTHTQPINATTVNYPQLTNGYSYTCPGGNYTLQQLSAAGWRIDIPIPHVLQIITTSTNVTTRTRYMILIQK